MDIAYPFRVDGRGRAAQSDYEDHVREMIEQVLFTVPGERVNRPDFGCGLMQLVFAPNSDDLASSTQFLVQGSLQQWLGEHIQLEAVRVENVDSSLVVTVQYRLLKNQEPRTAQFTREV